MCDSADVAPHIPSRILDLSASVLNAAAKNTSFSTDNHLSYMLQNGNEKLYALMVLL